MKTRSSQHRLPPTPTTALPGSREKVRVLAERVRLGVSLWHPLDATLATVASDASGEYPANPAEFSLAS